MGNNLRYYKLLTADRETSRAALMIKVQRYAEMTYPPMFFMGSNNTAHGL